MPSQHKKPDYPLLFVVLLLVSVGFIMIFSSTPSIGIKLGDAFYYIKRQIIYIILGLGALWFGWRFDYQKYRKQGFNLLILAGFLLLLVFMPGIGKSVGGANRWISLGLFSFQPSEIAKLAVIIFLASAISNKKDSLKNFGRGLLPLLLVVSILAFLVLVEPDLGTAMIIMSIFLVMSFVGGASLAQLLLLAGTGFILFLGLSFSSAYRRRRLLAFLNPWHDPRNVGFHIIQSLLAVGSGGFWGLGLGSSRQKFFYLPQQYTDFIFAILCEEAGFVGAVTLAALFLLFVIRGVKIVKEAPDLYSALLAAGIVAWIAIQGFVNMWVVVGLLPVSGFPLPFISYGGTSLIINLFSIGILLNISGERPA